MVSETGLYCGIPRAIELEPSSPAGDERRETKLALSITATLATSHSDIRDACVGPSPPGRRSGTPPGRRLQLIAAPPFTAIDPLLGVDRRQGQNWVSQGGDRDNRGYSVTAQSETQGVPGPEVAWTVSPGRLGETPGA